MHCIGLCSLEGDGSSDSSSSAARVSLPSLLLARLLSMVTLHSIVLMITHTMLLQTLMMLSTVSTNGNVSQALQRLRYHIMDIKRSLTLMIEGAEISLA